MQHAFIKCILLICDVYRRNLQLNCIIRLRKLHLSTSCCILLIYILYHNSVRSFILSKLLSNLYRLTTTAKLLLLLLLIIKLLLLLLLQLLLFLNL